VQDFFDMMTSKPEVASVAISGAGPFTLVAATPGRRAVLYHLWAKKATAGTATFTSAATPISGAIALADAQVLELRGSGMPVLKGLGLNQALTLTLSAGTLEGFALVCQIHQ
jgi:hypothetical protein